MWPKGGDLPRGPRVMVDGMHAHPSFCNGGRGHTMINETTAEVQGSSLRVSSCDFDTWKLCCPLKSSNHGQ